MTKFIDRLLNRISMYHLVIYVLGVWLGLAAILGWMGKLPFTGWQLISSAVFLLAMCWLVNRIFAWGFNASAHDDSAYITALILALIVTPLRHSADLPLLIWAPILAMAGKYIIAIHRQHLLNPAALAVAVTALAIGKSASWWIGTPIMLIPVIIGGWLVVRKVRRFDVVVSYLIMALLTVAIYALARGSNVITSLKQLILYSPLLFFAAIMLTEPFTMPPTHRWRIWYGLIVGFLSVPVAHLGSFYFTPEIALLTGNLLGWIVTRRERYVLTLRKQTEVAPSIRDFVFTGPRVPKFQPGQYLEWSLPHQHPDGRGTRRYFTIASSPTEAGLRLGVKYYQPMSSYKQSLLNLRPGQTIIAQQLDGDFTLPRDPRLPLIFIAGGIGVTPFRSMIRCLLDQRQPRAITLFFANQTADDIVYADIFEQARAELGLKTVYVLSNQSSIPADWFGQRGFVTAEMIRQEAPNYLAATFYISGPQAMVTNYVGMLSTLGLPKKRIKTDYFPGFA